MSWEEVKSLGDTVLFLGDTTNACCSAAELGLRKGYLYYTLPKDQYLYMFDVEDKCTTTILPCSKLPTPWFLSGWIMMPPLPTVSVAAGGRILENISNVRLDDYMIKSKEMEEIISKSDNLNLRKKQNEENLEEPGPWMVINEDIVDLIASHLHPVDFLHFRAVCKSNKVPIMKQIYENATCYNFVDPMHNNEKYLMNLPELLAGAIIHCQKGGWLLMSRGRFTLFFYNPFAKETIQLPESQCSYGFSGISFSSLPTCSDCVVFGITQQNEEEICIYVIKRRADSWRFPIFENSDLENYMPTFNEPFFHKGAFYCVDYNGTLGVFNEHKWSWSVLKRPRGFSNAAYVSFLVECEDELLLVRILEMSVTIFRLDSLKMVWRKVKSLGKHIFL
ncbi:F-box/kelch-repeat protein At1g57790-like [Papaver somniferum]|uniref:F-box/kelch-repeat protein At1g57790-like n=1 Tax=Papaver somniferum TaxID=3469 RepID=UPI000E6F69FB|nr:F-box/kelch-repeat protein At1g57790-like [Papaver somniferum]